MPCVYCRAGPRVSRGRVASVIAPPVLRLQAWSDEVPCSSSASSTKWAGIIEKSVMPITGEVMRMPFQSTWVCSGAVPRNEAVASVPRPYCLMKTVELCDRMSAIDRRCSRAAPPYRSPVRWMPICFMGRRRALTDTSRIETVRTGSSGAAAADAARSSVARGGSVFS